MLVKRVINKMDNHNHGPGMCSCFKEMKD